MTEPTQSTSSQSLAGKTAYLSGPCSGYPELNKPLFDLAEEKLGAALVENGFVEPDAEFPVSIVHPHQEGVYQNLAAAMQLADFVVLLPGWPRRGGTVEDLMVFIMQGKRVFYFDPSLGILVEMGRKTPNPTH